MLESKHETFYCECENPEHMFRIKAGADGKAYHALEFSVHLNHYLPWYKRVWLALKYVFRVGDDHFDTVMLDVRDVRHLRDCVEDFLRCQPADAAYVSLQTEGSRGKFLVWEREMAERLRRLPDETQGKTP